MGGTPLAVNTLGHTRVQGPEGRQLGEGQVLRPEPRWDQRWFECWSQKQKHHLRELGIPRGAGALLVPGSVETGSAILGPLGLASLP